ncbi:InlB B-repeat-containing protein [Christensenellaceae bacterium OttesenSCG-928-M15]|nr:InlB B-repeat-containing protein [Christensenellaceae bacterium OttesenSCG-928-M15]
MNRINCGCSCCGSCGNPCCCAPIPCPLPPVCPPCPPQVATYAVIYNPNGGIGGTADFNLSAGSSYTIKSDTQMGVTRPGYVFEAWNTVPNGSGTLYLPGDVITITQNLTLYAQWAIEPPNTVTVIYDPNGGTGGLIDTNVPVGSRYTIKSVAEANVMRPGDSFIEWNTKFDGSGVFYTPGSVITITNDLTLYAQWMPRPS